MLRLAAQPGFLCVFGGREGNNHTDYEINFNTQGTEAKIYWFKKFRLAIEA